MLVNNMYEIIKDVMGWSVMSKRTDKVWRNFWSREQAENFVKNMERELYQGSGVQGKEGLDKNAVKLGRKGGIATREKLGKEHYQNIQKLAVARRKANADNTSHNS